MIPVVHLEITINIYKTFKNYNELPPPSSKQGCQVLHYTPSPSGRGPG